jgi:uncharacterized protein DUF1549/uncharacterized protein DUF1553/cytochrome c
MMRPFSWTVVALALAAGSISLAAGPPPQPAAPDFNRDVRPILSRHCFKCHGPDDAQRKAGLRLDLRSAAVKPTTAGRKAIVPGKADQSELVRRIFAPEPGRVMPPPVTKNPLSEAEKLILKRWIAAGAEYRQHWAFVPPKQAPLPKVRLKSWPRNPIDTFVLARLEAAGLRPSPPADRYTLVRRVYLDLIGMPPTPEEADAFVDDQAPDAYEKLVERLLASSHYGERWARRWLDLARYADTNGYEKDRPRSTWPYRDWVINALNQDMPFDQFTIQQLAGDLLVEEMRKQGPGNGEMGKTGNEGPAISSFPHFPISSLIATGFHRNTMLNEEGGIDPLEYRFHAMTDRVSTTATTWLGLTVGCAQCHTHKFDPVPHREYYQFMAFLNNADEPEIPVPQPEITTRRAALEKQVAALEADLPNRFPAEQAFRWQTPAPSDIATAGGARAERLPDASIRLSGANPETDTYTVTLESDLSNVAAIRLEALPDPSLGNNGPGRTPHGNFVLTGLAATVAPVSAPGQAQAVKLVRAEADFAQEGFPAAHAIDGDPKTGWAIHGPDPWNVHRTATFYLEKPVSLSGGSRWVIRLEQQFGTKHTLGRFRLSLGQQAGEGGSTEAQRRERLQRKFDEWLAAESARAVRWTPLRPASAKSNLPLLTVLDDASVLASGDQTKRDLYDVSFRADLRGITAVRLEALPDDSLPKRGPGRIYYEGPHGDFFLSEVTLAAGGSPVRLKSASHTFASGGSTAQAALDGNPQTGWAINGGQGRAHTAVFNLAQPLGEGGELSLRLLFERYYAAGLGRFRVSVTTDARPAEARLATDVEALLTEPDSRRTAAGRERLFQYYLSVAPELAPEREAIRQLRAQMPEQPTTLVFTERPPQNPRPTFIHRRGEFLQPGEKVEPGVLSVLHPLPAGVPRNRLTFARWLVDGRNPLVGRVTVNRQWAAFFGTGIVRTTEDFGLQGDSPTHPELLDWLAIEFMKGRMGERGNGSKVTHSPTPPLSHSPAKPWSLKHLHRLIVTSATYQQSSKVTPDLLARDPMNRLLSRGPRFRLEAEQLRDSALKASSLLSPKLGGPSVFPPQPAGVTSEGTYGPLQWKTSEGPDRYRRGLYTFAKRTAPYAMFTTFDGPSGEACVARREVSNTPLQALTLLNDTVFLEAAQALGRMIAGRQGSIEERATYLFRRCLTRPPGGEELSLLVKFYHAQKGRLESKELDAAAIAGRGEEDANERAAWTLLARSLLNLDEAVVKP